MIEGIYDDPDVSTPRMARKGSDKAITAVRALDEPPENSRCARWIESRRGRVQTVGISGKGSGRRSFWRRGTARTGHGAWLYFTRRGSV